MQHYDYRHASGTVRIDQHRIRYFIAEDLMPDIEAWLRARPDQDQPIGIAKGIANGMLEIESARSRSHSYPHEEYIQAHVFVVSKPSPSRDAIVGGGVTAAHERNGSISIGVQAWLNASITAERYLKYLMRPERGVEQVQYGLYSLLIHEFTHAAEAMFKAPAQYGSYEKVVNSDRHDYYNDPKEVRAFMQQVADEVVHWAKHDALRHYAKGSNRVLIDRALKLSTTWKEIESSLTAANKRRVLSAVYAEVERRGHLFQ